MSRISRQPPKRKTKGNTNKLPLKMLDLPQLVMGKRIQLTTGVREGTTTTVHRSHQGDTKFQLEGTSARLTTKRPTSSAWQVFKKAKNLKKTLTISLKLSMELRRTCVQTNSLINLKNTRIKAITDASWRWPGPYWLRPTTSTTTCSTKQWTKTKW